MRSADISAEFTTQISGRQFKLALHIILLTLVRKSELQLARWEHIDFNKGEWLVPAENALRLLISTGCRNVPGA